MGESQRTPAGGEVAPEGRPTSSQRRIDVGIILNPRHAATLRAYADLVQGLRSVSAHHRSMTTSVERSGHWQAEQLTDWGADIVIILGGDGTIRAAAPVLAEAGILVFVIPTGTANVLSRHIGLGSSRQAIDHCVSTVASIIRGGTTNSVSVPVNAADLRQADGSRLRSDFISLAGIGGDARAVAHHHAAPGLAGYAWGAVRALFAANFTMRPGNAAQRPVWSVMASKAARPAGPIAVFPEARIEAETFSVLTVGPLPHPFMARCRAWAGIAAACLQGEPQTHPLMSYRSTAETTVALESPVPAQLDGDHIGDCVELRVSVFEKKILVSSPTA